MFSKKIRINDNGETISRATALVLFALDELTGDKDQTYGYEIMAHLKESYNWTNVKSGTIYPILRKLKNEKYIIEGIKHGDPKTTNRKQIFYSLNRKGRNLVNQIHNLNDRLQSTILEEQEQVKVSNYSEKSIVINFNDNKFVEKTLKPFMLQFEKNISDSVSETIQPEECEVLKSEILKAIKMIENSQDLLKLQINRINSRLNMDY